ncbi:MAG TPA: hypothetical protein PLI95_17595, partial [Polyangiaceae bacterium]|nr:hypothetical protein [Polyangiaceae bacterium]
EKAAAEKAAAEKAAAEKAAIEKPAERAIAAPEKRGLPAVVWVVGAVIVAIIAYVVFFMK